MGTPASGTEFVTTLTSELESQRASAQQIAQHSAAIDATSSSASSPGSEQVVDETKTTGTRRGHGQEHPCLPARRPAVPPAGARARHEGRRLHEGLDAGPAGQDGVDHDVTRNEARNRYELRLDGEVVGIADFVMDGDVMVLPHTVIEPDRRGQGLGDVLVDSMYATPRSRGTPSTRSAGSSVEFLPPAPGGRGNTLIGLRVHVGAQV